MLNDFLKGKTQHEQKIRAPSDALLLKGHTVKSDSINEFKGKNKPLEYKGNQ